jgi:hypothetical protein
MTLDQLLACIMYPLITLCVVHLVTVFIFLHTGWYPFGDVVLQIIGGYRF